MKKTTVVLLIFMLLSVWVMPYASSAEEETWRSVLYPENWEPGYTTEDGMFLQDYSYAGYHRGEKELPDEAEGLVYDVSDYGADPTGEDYSTDAIQAAIDDAQSAGGGTVYIPEGLYKVRPESGNNYVFRVNSNNIVIKGAGIDSTKIYNDEPYMRNVSIVLFTPENFVDWISLEEIDPILLSRDISEGSMSLPLESVEGYSVGDWIMVRSDATEEFIAEHSQTGKWNTSITPLMYYRCITGIDGEDNTVDIDIPVRYKLKTRDNARIYKINIQPLTEVGIQDISFGMLENLKSDLGEESYTKEGTAAYECHLSNFVKMSHVVNGWIKSVGSFKPEQNTKNIHTLSGGIYLQYSRGITVSDCSMQLSLYEGGGGNGYLYNLKGQECLVKNCYAYHGRHNYSFGGMYCSGNVLTSSKTSNADRETDMHMHLTHANLLDKMYVSGDQLEGINRNSYGSENKHGHSSTQVVFWNTYGNSYQSGEKSIVESQQYGMGYVVGTCGSASKISVYDGDSTSPIDFTEGEGVGATLVPQSLYEDQFSKRLERMGAPIIDKTFPADGESMYEKSQVKVVFKNDMDEASVINKDNIIISPEAEYVAQYDKNDKTLTIDFPDGLTDGAEYTVTFKAGGITSAQGTALLNQKTIRFTALSDMAVTLGAHIFVGDGFAYADTELTNVTSSPLRAVLAIAMYEANKLIQIETTVQEVSAGNTVKIQTDVINSSDSNNVYYKAFLWEKDMLSPLALADYRAGNDPSILTLEPVDDSYVRNGGYNNDNYGGEDFLAVKDGSSNFRRNAFLKFDLNNMKGNVRKAVIRLYGYCSDFPTSYKINIKEIEDDSWTEEVLTWKNAPVMGISLGSVTYTGEGSYCELDVTEYINRNIGGYASFGIDTSSKDYLSISSKEAASNHPQLIIEY